MKHQALPDPLDPRRTYLYPQLAQHIAKQIAELLAAEDVYVFADDSRHRVVAKGIVPDMVPCLRRFTILADAAFIWQVGGPVQALDQALMDTFHTVTTEREIRRWSHCDP